MPDPGDHREFQRDNYNRHGRRYSEIWNQIGNRVPEASQGCHQSAYTSADPGMSSSAERSVVAQRFSESHTDPSTDRSRDSDEKSGPAIVGSERRGEDRSQGGHRAIHQARQAWLHYLENKEFSARFFLFRKTARLARLLDYCVGHVFVAPFRLGQVPQELARICRGYFLQGLLIEPPCLRFHSLHFAADPLRAQNRVQPDRLPVHKAFDVTAANERDVVAESLLKDIDQLPPVNRLFLVHLSQQLCGFRVLVLHPLTKLAVNAPVLFLKGDGQRQNTLLVQFL